MPLAVWSVIYISYLKYYGVDISFYKFLHTPVMYHLWFAYSICGIYILFPLLSSLYYVMLKDRKLVTYILILWCLVYSMSPYYEITMYRTLSIGHDNLIGYCGYFLLGAIIFSNVRNIPFSYKVWLSIYLLFSLLTLAIVLFLSTKKGSWDFTAYNYLTLNVIVSSICFFICIMKINIKPFNKFFSMVSKNTLFIYFIHVLIIAKLEAVTTKFPVFISTLLLIFLTFFICILLSIVTKKIPIINKLLG